MKLFIFEPYKWSYCGGAIGVLAKSFEDAVTRILVADKERAKKLANKEAWQRGLMPMEEFINRRRTYKRDHFSKDKRTFKNNCSGQWLLTNTMGVNLEPISRIVFANWKYS